MTDEYTPTVEDVREAYQVAGDGADFKRRFNERGTEFDRMIAAVERAARVEALREAAALAKQRQIDMEQCRKPDDCNLSARGAYLTCEDIIARAEDVERGVRD
jgi:hypothetical protein